MKGIVYELREVDRRLGALWVVPREPCEGFDSLTEIRDAVETVRSDLLADAVETLTVAAEAEVDDLRLRYWQRRQWVVTEAN